jgi:MFS family permease
MVANVPFGALADRFSRRAVLAVAGVVQAGGYALWTVWHAFAGFAAGFALWGLAGSLVEGAFEALLYDGLAAAGAQDHYVRVQGRVQAAQLGAVLAADAAATVLFSVGGFALVGWTSVGVCLATALLALRLPEARPTESDEGDDELGYLATLRDGLRAAVRQRGLRHAIIVVALLAGLDAIEEYFPLSAQAWGVPARLVPVALLGIPIGGALGAWLGGLAGRLRPITLALILGVAFVGLAAAGILHVPVGLILVAGYYFGYQGVLVVLSSRLQDRIDADHRATVTSVLGLATDVTAIACYAAWPLGQIVLVAAIGLVIAVAVPLVWSGRDQL